MELYDFSHRLRVFAKKWSLKSEHHRPSTRAAFKSIHAVEAGLKTPWSFRNSVADRRYQSWTRLLQGDEVGRS